MQKVSVKLSKPRYCGVAVLGISKWLMADFHYNHIHRVFGAENVRVLMTDTDSFCYHINAPPNIVYPALKEKMKTYMDFSNYKNSQRYSHYYDSEGARRKVPGYFKDECGGNFILSFAGISIIFFFFFFFFFLGICSKVYSLEFDDGREIKKLKGVSSPYVESKLSHKNYLEAIFTQKYSTPNKDTLAEFLKIESKKHQLKTVRKRKKTIVTFNNKKYFENMFKCKSFGHKDIIYH